MDLDPIAGDALDQEPFQWIALVATESDPQLVGGQVDAPFADGAAARLHRAGQPLAKRLYRELPQPFPRRMPQSGMAWKLCEARVVIEDWRQHYNTERPHSRLDYLSGFVA